MWFRDLEALEKKLDVCAPPSCFHSFQLLHILMLYIVSILQEQDLQDASAVAKQKDYKNKQKIEVGARPKNIPKVPRKANNKKATNAGGSETTMETSSSIAMEIGERQLTELFHALASCHIHQS